ncbi:hypothetical protein V6N13_103209 [Hibiscus sabdariffa]
MDASVSIFRPLAQQLSYLFGHKNKFQDLRSKVQDLKDARERVQQSVDSANREGEVSCSALEGLKLVSQCDEKKGVSSNIRLFPKLDLGFEFLPKLKRFCYGINPIKFSFIMYLLIREFPYLNSSEHIIS